MKKEFSNVVKMQKCTACNMGSIVVTFLQPAKVLRRLPLKFIVDQSILLWFFEKYYSNLVTLSALLGKQN